MNRKEKINKAICDYTNGSLTIESEKYLHNWLMESSEHKQQFAQQVRDFVPTNHDDMRLLDALNTTREAISQKRKKEKKRSLLHYSVKKWIQVAAILVVGIGLKFAADFILLQYDGQEEMCTITAPLGQKSKILLPDSTVVWLNSESTITFPVSFKRERKVKLLGEAYFEVTHKLNKKFIVKTKMQEVIVHGTKFNVMAYSDFGFTRTSLLEGKVEVKKQGESLFLEPGSQLILCDGQFTEQQVDVKQAVAWKDNKFYFELVSVAELVRRLERWYDVDIRVQNKDLLSQNFSGVFKNEETIWEVLDALQKYIDFEYEKKQTRIIEIK